MLALYKPTPIPVIHRALAMAKVGPEDTVYDLGSGDGRVLESAARMFKARAVGIEINYALVRESRPLERDPAVSGASHRFDITGGRSWTPTRHG